MVNNLLLSYRIPASYTLTDDDVEVIDGIIQTCSYNFALKDIIIPDTLDGQAIVGFTNEGFPKGFSG
jgi:hypothetical protein